MIDRLHMAENGHSLAAKALFSRDEHAEQMGLEDYEDGLVDALVNLMHFADRYDIDFQEHLDRADRHFRVESTYDWHEVPGLDPKGR
jgi:hypothetical protein